MNYINPPTDSLYKFCSIVGVVIYVISFYLPWKMLAVLEDRIAKFSFEIENKKADMEYQNQYIKHIEMIVGLTDNATISLFSDSTNSKLQINNKEAYLKNRIIDTENKIKNIGEYKLLLLDAIRKNAISKAEIDLSGKEIGRISKRVTFMQWVNIIGMILGILLSLYGFLNWYYKIQVYQDKIIKKQASE